uniref:Folate-biopterin transporter n=1 Tax=Planktothrix pseudagardhii TaxID=132604 RepID=A0A9W4CLZ9_9CYAN|nr:Folate-biopterin transporter [Planktothrix pseudagardhii]
MLFCYFFSKPYLSGWLLENFTSQTVFGITAFFPLIVSGVAGLIAEKSVSDLKPHRTDPSNIHQKVTLLWNTLRQKYILLPTLFICIWQATPNTESAFFYFTTNELGFSPEFLGRVRLVTSLATLLGIGIYQRYLKAVSFRKILGWSIVLSSLLGMTTLILVTHANRAIGINDHWFSLGDSAVLTVMGQIAFMPVFVMSARLCPPGIEATLFAFLLSAFGLSGMIAYELGALLTHWLGISNLNFENLWILVVIANLSTLLPLPLLGWLPNQNSQQES